MFFSHELGLHMGWGEASFLVIIVIVVVISDLSVVIVVIDTFKRL